MNWDAEIPGQSVGVILGVTFGKGKFDIKAEVTLVSDKTTELIARTRMHDQYEIVYPTEWKVIQ